MSTALREHYADQLHAIDERMRAGFALWPWGHHDRMRALVERQVARKGKRLRSLFGLLCAELLGGDLEKTQPLAAAVELYHAASLVLDDVQDNADFRGRDRAVHVSESVSNAINLACVVRSFAHHPLHCSDLTLIEKDGVRRQLDVMATLVPLGQSMDIGWHQGWYEFRSVPYEELIRLKTGAPFACVAAGAAVTGGQGEATRAAMERLGYRVGILYQLVDDHNDMFRTVGDGDGQGAAGRMPDDLVEGKFTRPIGLLCERLSADGRDDLAEQVVARLREPGADGPRWILDLMAAHSVAARSVREIHDRAVGIERDAATLSHGHGGAMGRMSEFVRHLAALADDGSEPFEVLPSRS
ncbi:polyprenyl synthetase family protein [Streptomyces sp. NPDC090073]|uniref:polyprenyl synthetase family protein n=1 Tax=Streptomyces sp. NPDC090073 TaxID=3365936 RepID=UPI0037F81982